MRQTKRFAVVGSDARQAAAGRALARAGYPVGGVQQLPQADCILLPLPLEQSGLPLAQLLGAAKPGALALGGKVTESALSIARAAGVELVDYFARPELTVYNAIPTAEGCIGILLERRSRTLWGAAVLVLGFGPVGRALAVRLAALGARVTVAARRPVQRAAAPPAPCLPADTPPPSQRPKAVRRCGGSACAWSVSSCYGSFPVIVPYLPPGAQGLGVLSRQIYANH